MNDQTTWAHQVADWLAAAGGTLLMALAVYINKRFTAQGRRIGKLEREAVTRDELKEALQRMSDERQLMHNQNREDLQYIRERVDKLVGE